MGLHYAFPQIRGIDDRRRHLVMEKLDGSMIRPLRTPFGIRWGTEMGITDVAMLAEEWVADKGNYIRFAENMMRDGWTPIFEFCSRRARIVIDYPEERLVLTAIRHTETGAYADYDALQSIGAEYGLDVVKADWLALSDMRGFVETKRAEEGDEGVVIRFSDGHMVKVKNDWYVRIHRAKDALRSERRVVELLLAEGLDDLIPVLPEADREAVLSYAQRFYREVSHAAMHVKAVYSSARQVHPDKRSFAVSTSASAAAWERSAVFALWDGKTSDAGEWVVSKLKRSLSTERGWQETKDELGLRLGWSYGYAEAA